MQHMQRSKCFMSHSSPVSLTWPVENIFSPLTQSQRMLIGSCKACSHRHGTEVWVPTLTAHCIVGVRNRPKSSPELGEVLHCMTTNRSAYPIKQCFYFLEEVPCCKRLTPDFYKHFNLCHDNLQVNLKEHLKKTFYMKLIQFDLPYKTMVYSDQV